MRLLVAISLIVEASCLHVLPVARRPLPSLATRLPPPRAAFDLAAALPSTSLLAAEDVFGEVFMAGMSIAFAAVGTTVFVGIIIRSRFDAIEDSFFDAQEEMAEESSQVKEGDNAAVTDFFGDTAPQSSARPDPADKS